MILLTKFDSSKVIVTFETIKYIESTPDTLIRFLNGDTILVKEAITEILQKAVTLHAKILYEAKKLETSS